MLETTANKFRAELKKHIDSCIENHQVLKVKRKRGDSFVVLGSDDWQAIEETLFLNLIPGMVESIHKADKEPLTLGTKLKDLTW